MLPIARCFGESGNVALLRIGKAGMEPGQFLISFNILWVGVISGPKFSRRAATDRNGGLAGGGELYKGGVSGPANPKMQALPKLG